MPRRTRTDYPGAWHHVMNRGIARRTIFESREDTRYFLSRLAYVVHRGGFELHAWCLMTTHFHLLVRSVDGDLPTAMQWIQDLYVRWFNRRRRRDGPLFRGRYRSKQIESDAHWDAVVRYIDDNPVQARMVGRAIDYPHSSAQQYAQRSGPRWLTRGPVEQLVCRSMNAEHYNPLDYCRKFAGQISIGERHVAEQGIEGGGNLSSSLDNLIGAAPTQVLEWMRRKATLADGSLPGVLVASPVTLQAVLTAQRSADPGRRLRSKPKRPFWTLAEAGLLRCAGGLRFSEIGLATQVSSQTARKRVLGHQSAMDEDGEYGEVVAGLLECALTQDFGVPARPAGGE